MPRLDSRRSTCLIACLVQRPRASARPWPIMPTANEADWITPSVAPASDFTRLACNSSPNSGARKPWTPSNASGLRSVMTGSLAQSNGIEKVHTGKLGKALMINSNLRTPATTDRF